MKKIILMAIGWMAGHAAIAQVAIKGKVTVGKGEPLVAASLQLKASASGEIVRNSVSDGSGLFNLSPLDKGVYVLSVSSVGYGTYLDTVVVYGNSREIVHPDIRLEPLATGLAEVRVVQRRKLVENHADRTVLNVQNSPTAAGSTVLEVITRAPEVEIDRANNEIGLNGKQGVIVLINGKQLRMDAAGLLQYLDGLPASNVKKIEFIHTPPASYDASGSAGVINITLVRPEEDKIGGSLNATYGYGVRPKYDMAANLYYNRRKLSIQADFSTSNNFTEQDYHETAVSMTRAAKENIDLQSRRPVYLGVQNGKLSLDYALSSKTSVSVLLAGYLSNWEMNASTDTYTTTDHGGYNLSKLKSDETNFWRHYMTSAGIKHQFNDRSSLEFTVDYLNFIDQDPTNYENHDFDQFNHGLDTSVFYSRKRSPIHFEIAQLDFKKEIRKGLSFEMGVKATTSHFVNDVEVFTMNNGLKVVDDRFTSIIANKETIGAAYLSLNYKLSSVDQLQAGLRYETDDNKLDSNGIKQLLHTTNGRLYPTLIASHRFPGGNTLEATYTERIVRPTFAALAPTFFFFGPNNVIAGNPALQATISRDVSIGYRIKNLGFTVRYSYEKSPSYFQPGVDTVQGIVLTRYENIDYLQTGMASVNYSTNTGIWSSQTSLSLFLQKSRAVANNIPIMLSRNYVSFNTTQTLRLPHHFALEMSSELLTLRNYGFGTKPFQLGLNLAIQKNIKEGQRIAFSWTDITRQSGLLELDYNQPQLNMIYNFHYQYEGSILKLSYFYQFGRKLNAVKTRTNISEEELKRVN